MKVKGELKIFFADRGAQPPAGEADVDVGIDFGGPGVAKDAAGLVGGDRIAALEDSQRASFLQDGMKIQ